jgi:exosortase
MQTKRREDGQREGRHSMTRRNLYCLLATLLATGLCWAPLKNLVSFAFHSNIYFYSGVIPLMSAALIYLEKERIFSCARYNLGIGLALISLALVIGWCNKMYLGAWSPNNSLSLGILSFVVLLAGVFVLCYGTKAFRAAAFQWSLLLLMVPLPPALLERAILVMRECSTQAAGILFRLGGVPFFRSGFRFSLPGMDLEVAEQCSGIRSGLSFLITSLLMGHLFLRSSWGRLGLVLAAFPITIFKNGLRIVTIYGLSIHPSMVSLVAWVHRYGGIPFSFLGLALLATLVASLRKFEEAARASGRIMGGGPGIGERAAGPTLDLTCQ